MTNSYRDYDNKDKGHPSVDDLEFNPIVSILGKIIMTVIILWTVYLIIHYA